MGSPLRLRITIPSLTMIINPSWELGIRRSFANYEMEMRRCDKDPDNSYYIDIFRCHYLQYLDILYFTVLLYNPGSTRFFYSYSNSNRIFTIRSTMFCKPVVIILYMVQASNIYSSSFATPFHLAKGHLSRGVLRTAPGTSCPQFNWSILLFLSRVNPTWTKCKLARLVAVADRKLHSSSKCFNAVTLSLGFFSAVAVHVPTLKGKCRLCCDNR